jgi:hypothetical protein
MEAARTPADDLRERVRALCEAGRVPDLRARAAGDLSHRDETAWAVVRLAAALRAAGDAEAGLRLLETAVRMRPGDRVQRAIATVAIEAHCDRGSARAAASLVRRLEDAAVDERLARAAARAYDRLVAETGDGRYAPLRDRWAALADELTAAAA